MSIPLAQHYIGTGFSSENKPLQKKYVIAKCLHAGDKTRDIVKIPHIKEAMVIGVKYNLHCHVGDVSDTTTDEDYQYDYNALADHYMARHQKYNKGKK